jgi:hypothetical protein
MISSNYLFSIRSINRFYSWVLFMNPPNFNSVRKEGNREQGTGNREQGTGNREQGTDKKHSFAPV